MEYKATNLQQKLKLIEELWQPKVIAEMNDYQFKLVKLEGDLSGTITRRRMRRSS